MAERRRALHVHSLKGGETSLCETNVKIAVIGKCKDAALLAELREAVNGLRAAGHQVVPRLTFDRADAARFARTAALRHADLVIVAGGDGTVNEVVNGMARCGAVLPRLAVIPLGTANDFAKGLQIPDSIAEALSVALNGEAAQVDVAEVNGRCFVNVSTGGFGPDITESASSESKKRFGKFAYLFSALHRLARLQSARAIFETDAGILYEGPFFFFAVGNARHTGGGTPVTPRASYNDAKLDLTVVTGDRRRDFLTLLPDLRAGRHLDDPDVLYLKTRQLKVRAVDPFPVNADGEPVRAREFSYRLLERPITVMRG